MSSRPKKKRYSLEEVEDMLMNYPDSGDSDLDLGEDFAALDIESNSLYFIIQYKDGWS